MAFDGNFAGRHLQCCSPAESSFQPFVQHHSIQLGFRCRSSGPKGWDIDRSCFNRHAVILQSWGKAPGDSRYAIIPSDFLHMSINNFTVGLSDPLNPPTWPIEYLSQIANVTANISDSMRLFMIPGGGHCGPSPGVPQAPNKVGYIQPLMDWVEMGRPPVALKASDPKDGTNRTRKLCSWPQKARFNGGVPDNWVDYTCI